MENYVQYMATTNMILTSNLLHQNRSLQKSPQATSWERIFGCELLIVLVEPQYDHRPHQWICAPNCSSGASI